MRALLLATLLLAPLTILAANQDPPEAASALAAAREQTGQLHRLVSGTDLATAWSPSGSVILVDADTHGGPRSLALVDAASGVPLASFSSAELAAKLATSTGLRINPSSFRPQDPGPADDGTSLTFSHQGQAYAYFHAEDRVGPVDLPPAEAPLISPQEAPRASSRTGVATTLTFSNETAQTISLVWRDASGNPRTYATIPPGDSHRQGTFAGHVWIIEGPDDAPLAAVETPERPSLARVKGRVRPSQNRDPRPGSSPDGRLSAQIRDHNVVLIPADGSPPVALTSDGTAADRYQPPLLWSPDSQKLVAFRSQPVELRQIHFVESSPSDQTQPRLRSINYPKPGDPIAQRQPQLFHVETRVHLSPDPSLFSEAWDIGHFAWAADSSSFSFVYNARGHQTLRLLSIDAASAEVLLVHEERSETFIDYSQKFYLNRLSQSPHTLWASESSGHNHLYLIDGTGSDPPQPITSGDWDLHRVIHLDEGARELIFERLGVPGQDPYHRHLARASLDGGASTLLTASDGHHTSYDFSPDRSRFVTTWSRPDHPPVTELRDARSGELITVLHQADDSRLRASGWVPPERFSAPGRDGTTPIYGLIFRPSHFDPQLHYPIVEDIYAGPHSHFVPKSFSPSSRFQTLAELGFIVVSIDGMGTNWRGKKFHDVAWKNLADSGFPDRIPWVQAAAASRPWMDLSRVGIIGGSAGGQSALAALLHHGDFYHVAVADCGCHDNRMDKIWWNEAWMGYPVDDSYAENSNVTHAHKLRGKLLLIVGELDTNVDPASTTQVVHALQKANKDFDFLPLPGVGHGAAESPYGQRRRAAFLLKHLPPPRP